MRIVGALVVLLFILGGTANGQSGTADSARVLRPTLRLPGSDIVIAGGGVFPVSHSALTELWGPGAQASAAFYVHVNPMVALGVGLEAGFLKFSVSAFEEKYPGLPPKVQDLGLLHLFLGWRYTIVPSARFAPYLAASLGAVKLSRALYQETINGKRVTYYEIPGRTRLALGAGIGVSYILSRVTVLEAEGRALYFHNDPEAGICITARAGLRFNIF